MVPVERNYRGGQYGSNQTFPDDVKPCHMTHFATLLTKLGLDILWCSSKVTWQYPIFVPNNSLFPHRWHRNVTKFQNSPTLFLLYKTIPDFQFWTVIHILANFGKSPVVFMWQIVVFVCRFYSLKGSIHWGMIPDKTETKFNVILSGIPDFSCHPWWILCFGGVILDRSLICEFFAMFLQIVMSRNAIFLNIFDHHAILIYCVYVPLINAVLSIVLVFLGVGLISITLFVPNLYSLFNSIHLEFILRDSLQVLLVKHENIWNWLYNTSIIVYSCSLCCLVQYTPL